MYMWTLFVLYLVEVNCESSSEASELYYECGAHGRFEYCINGIPGCVIGCHCYPGYYFDTDTKICEPNIKLTQNLRRQFMEDYNKPTRAPIISVATIGAEFLNPTPTTSNPIDEKVDAIAKDSDDLGDWLYNQFFKTIENQVINSTDNNPMTRRSGNQVAKPIPKSLRRSRKRGKKKSKKSILKKKGLRRKLLRITEDDSLFDDSSSASSSDDSSSGSSSSASDTSDDQEHGHRKIVMINKKPSPPLPSFIFLPNVETPFYPPIGLPPPPVIPMYPMVPIPPVGPYFSGFHEVPCTDNETHSTSAPTTTTHGVTTTETKHTTTTPEMSSSSPEPDPPGDGDKPVHRARGSSNPHNKKAQKADKHAERNRILQNLREKMLRRNKQSFPINVADQDPEMAYVNDFEPPSRSMGFSSKRTNEPSPDPRIKDVDFKYLSELIHKANLNETNPELPFKLSKKMIDLPNRPFRRNYANVPAAHYESPQNLRPASKADDDSYYTNLGRQIASLIRKVDTDGDRQINIEIEHQNEDPMQTIFNGNRYSPRSYWERFVRSPLNRRRSYLQEMNYLKNSNENLFNLEDQVSVAAAVERAFSLHELENIANIMERTQSKSRQKITKFVRAPATTSRSYNIDLLPRVNRLDNDITQAKVNYIIQKNKSLKESNPIRNGPSINHYSLYPSPTPQSAVPFLKYRNETHSPKNVSLHMENRKKQDRMGRILKFPSRSPLDGQVSRNVYKNVTRPNTRSSQQVLKYQLTPMTLNYKSLKYAGNKHNQYPTLHSFVPLQVPFYPNLGPSTGRNGHPSYYHHELHHFDFFD